MVKEKGNQFGERDFNERGLRPLSLRTPALTPMIFLA
jgi:hypothetical protein